MNLFFPIKFQVFTKHTSQESLSSLFLRRFRTSCRFNLQQYIPYFSLSTHLFNALLQLVWRVNLGDGYDIIANTTWWVDQYGADIGWYEESTWWPDMIIARPAQTGLHSRHLLLWTLTEQHMLRISKPSPIHTEFTQSLLWTCLREI